MLNNLNNSPAAADRLKFISKYLKSKKLALDFGKSRCTFLFSSKQLKHMGVRPSRHIHFTPCILPFASHRPQSHGPESQIYGQLVDSIPISVISMSNGHCSSLIIWPQSGQMAKLASSRIHPDMVNSSCIGHRPPQTWPVATLIDPQLTTHTHTYSSQLQADTRALKQHLSFKVY